MVKIGRPNFVISSSPPPPPTISNAGEKFIGEGRGVTRAPQNSGGGVVGKRGSRDCAVLRRGALVVGLPLTIPASYPILPLASLIENAPPPPSPFQPSLVWRMKMQSTLFIYECPSL